MSMLPKPSQPIGMFDGHTGRWILCVHWICKVDDSWILCLDPGFVSDGASIPRVLWPIVGPRYDPKYFPAALAHDALYAAELLTRKECDISFYRLLLALGVEPWKANAMYLAVRMFGWIPWSRHTETSVAEARKLACLRRAAAFEILSEWL